MIDSVFAWRDRRLASPRFRSLSARFPLTRPIARRSANELFDLTAGFVYSQALFAIVELGLPALLRARPRTADEVAAETGLPLDGASRLLDAGVALKLFSRRSKDRYGLGQLGAALEGDPGVKAMIAHHKMLYADLADPVALLRARGGGALARYWAYAGAGEGAGALADGAVADYSALMARSQSFVAEDVLDAHSFRGNKRLLDVGGGEGAFLIAAAKRWPALELALFDLPAVADRASSRFAEAGLGGRARAYGGDLFSDALPGGADAVSLVRVLHDHDDAPAAAILAAVHRALPAGGTVLVAEPLADMAGAERVGHGYFGLYLAAMGSGRPRSAAEIEAMLLAARFTRPASRLTRGALPLGLVTAVKPA